MTRLFAIFAAILFLAVPGQAQEKEIQDVINDQISALQADDFETAFTYAAPNIRMMFRTPERFGRMVRDGYPMVHRPQTYSFEDLRDAGGMMFQNVQIEGQDGFVYIAEYAMIQTSDGWKITGVRVYPTSELST